MRVNFLCDCKSFYDGFDDLCLIIHRIVMFTQLYSSVCPAFWIFIAPKDTDS